MKIETFSEKPLVGIGHVGIYITGAFFLTFLSVVKNACKLHDVNYATLRVVSQHSCTFSYVLQRKQKQFYMLVICTHTFVYVFLCI